MGFFSRGAVNAFSGYGAPKDNDKPINVRLLLTAREREALVNEIYGVCDKMPDIMLKEHSKLAGIAVSIKKTGTIPPNSMNQLLYVLREAEPFGAAEPEHAEIFRKLMESFEV